MASDQLWNANIQYRSLLVEAIPPGARHVLDVGCGDGILSAQLAQAGGPHVVGLDLDPGVLQRARTRHRGVAVEWRQGDLFDVPFDTGSFDAVVCVATVHHLSAEAGLVRLADLVSHGGVVAVVGACSTAASSQMLRGTAFGCRFCGSTASRPRYSLENAAGRIKLQQTHAG